MAASRSRKIVFPENIHQIAAEIRRQALQHPDRDPVVPGARRARPKRKAKGRTTARRAATTRRGGGSGRARAGTGKRASKGKRAGRQ